MNESQFDLFGLAEAPRAEPKKSKGEKAIDQQIKLVSAPDGQAAPVSEPSKANEVDIFADLESFLSSDFINESDPLPVKAVEVAATPVESLLPKTDVSASPEPVSATNLLAEELADAILAVEEVPQDNVPFDDSTPKVATKDPQTAVSTQTDTYAGDDTEQQSDDPREVMDIVEFSLGEPPKMMGYFGKYRGMWLHLTTQAVHFVRLSAEEKMAMKERLKQKLIEGTKSWK